MFKKFKLMIMILMVVLLTTSCWSRREIEDLGFILGIGISKTDKGLYSVTAQVANTAALKSEAPDPRSIYTIIESEGLTAFDALRNMSMIAGRRLYLAHVKVIVIDEKLAQEGIGQIVGFLIQDMEIRLEFKVFVSQIPPKDILDTPNTRGLIPAIVLQTAYDNYGANSKVFISDLQRAVEAVNNPVINYVTTLVEKIPAPTNHEMDVLKFNKIAIFDNDQLKGYLDYEEAQGFNFITENFENGLIVYECNESTDTITVEILESTVNITPSYTDGKISFHIQLNVSGNLAERVSPTNRILQLDMAVVEEQLASVLEDKLRKSISKAQEDFQVDYFNLSKYFYQKYPNEFKKLQDDWNTVFSSADISIKVDTSVIHSALNLNNGRM